MNKLAMGSDPMFGRERDVLDRPAVTVDGLHGLGLQQKRRRQQPGLGKKRVVNGVHAENVGVGMRFDIGTHQLLPDVGADRAALLLPSLGAIWRRGGERFVLSCAR